MAKKKTRTKIDFDYFCTVCQKAMLTLSILPELYSIVIHSCLGKKSGKGPPYDNVDFLNKGKNRNLMTPTLDSGAYGKFKNGLKVIMFDG